VIGNDFIGVIDYRGLNDLEKIWNRFNWMEYLNIDLERIVRE
jgi:hypothetical protein